MRIKHEVSLSRTGGRVDTLQAVVRGQQSSPDVVVGMKDGGSEEERPVDWWWRRK
jgi:hypothetical protein